MKRDTLNGMKRVNVNINQMQVFRMKSKGGIKINCQCKELIDKGVCDEGFISNRNKKQMKINSALAHCTLRYFQ